MGSGTDLHLNFSNEKGRGERRLISLSARGRLPDEGGGHWVSRQIWNYNLKAKANQDRKGNAMPSDLKVAGNG